MRGGWWVLGLLIGGMPAVAGAQTSAPDGDLGAALLDAAERLVSPERCGECHAAAFEVWQTTPHATGFNELHRRDSAKAIYESLGLRTIKRGDEEATPACLQCHYTPEVRRGALRAANGVTCESCHGPARDWVDVHSDYGVGGADRQAAARAETQEHRAARIANAVAGGMRRPSQLYEVAANCFGCHTVPNEEIVNVANHTTGGDFELVERSQGDIRHNFLESFTTGRGDVNAERPAEWKRLMYVAGRALDFEYSLRGVAAATVDGRYLDGMSSRVGSAVETLAEMSAVVPLPEVDRLMEIFGTVDLVPNNAAALNDAADQVQAITKAFIASYDGTELAALDPFWDPDAPVVEPAPGAAVGARASLDPAPPAETAANAPNPGGEGAPPDAPPPDRAPPQAETAGAAASAGTESPGATAAPPPPPAPAARYEVHAKPPWREAPSHRFVKTVPCGGCHEHAGQTQWWESDPHSGTIDAFRANTTEARDIARAYGIAPDAMMTGGQTCMWCHGTITSSVASVPVSRSVGCQRCHGAGKDYEKSHETEDYAASVAKGLADLKNADVRARTCAGCHYITDPGLLAAGHSAGDGFDLAERMSQIKHWGPEFGGDATDIGGSALSTAYQGVLAARGPIPQVTRATTPPPGASGGASGASQVADDRPPGASSRTDVGGATVAPRPPAGSRSQPRFTPPSVRSAAGSAPGSPARPRGGSGGSGAGSSPGPEVSDPEDLPPLEVDDTTPTERILLRLKERLEALYDRLGRPSPQ